jgi:hypothetical protein
MEVGRELEGVPCTVEKVSLRPSSGVLLMLYCNYLILQCLISITLKNTCQLLDHKLQLLGNNGCGRYVRGPSCVFASAVDSVIPPSE